MTVSDGRNPERIIIVPPHASQTPKSGSQIRTPTGTISYPKGICRIAFRKAFVIPTFGYPAWLSIGKLTIFRTPCILKSG